MSGMNDDRFQLFDTVALIVFAYMEAALMQVKRVPIHLTHLSANSQFFVN